MQNTESSQLGLVSRTMSMIQLNSTSGNDIVNVPSTSNNGTDLDSERNSKSSNVSSRSLNIQILMQFLI